MDANPLVNVLTPLQQALGRQRDQLRTIRQNERVDADEVREVQQLMADIGRDLDEQIARLRGR